MATLGENAALPHVLSMRSFLIAASVLIAVGMASSVDAQTWVRQRNVSVADQHRYETERLRQQSQEQAAFARQNQLGARLTQQDLRAARAPEPYIPMSPIVPHTPEAARRNRETTVSGVSQIDDWLDRTPR